MFEGICEAIHREMDRLDEKYASGKAQLNGQDLKSLATYEAMKGESEYGGTYRGSYARGRSRMTGRYISRDADPYYHGEVPNGYER